ncbi:DUF2793 domain-containing protein [Hyphomicrobium sp.]|uniref:DUF2793 domain-containing protein n=1 Tax=Hyphomicrobium sp. TaxID=82 RepID=UPI002FE186EB
MDNTANLSLPYIMPAQAQKHVTHNEALRALDALVQLAVIDRDLTAAPDAPEDGDRYIVAASATGVWSGKDTQVAVWQDGGWTFLEPGPGWLCFVMDENVLVFWTGAQWEDVASALGALQNLSLFGVGTTADTENRFAAKLNKALWAALTTGEGGSGDLRYTMNKQAAGHVLSLLLQSNWSGRAEIGLIGADDLSMKVSPDGTNWTEALKVDRNTGRVTMPKTNLLTDFAVSLLPDSGRFAGNAAVGTTVSAYSFPSYFTLYNGTTTASAGKYMTDNTDYGGAGGSLPAHAKALIDVIRAPAMRRYGVEFFLAELTKGAGTASSPVVNGGVSYYTAAFLAFGPRAPRMTFHVYLRALNRLVYRWNPEQTIIKNGVAYTTHVPIDPTEGWVSITVWDEQNPYNNSGYSPTPFTLAMASAGDKCLVACPALMGGITQVDDNVGVIAGLNRWLP